MFYALIDPKFVLIGLPYFGAYFLVVALTVRYARPRSIWLGAVLFSLGLAVGWWTQSVVREYGESHPGSSIDRNAKLVEYLIPMFASVVVVISMASLARVASRAGQP